MFDSLAGDEMFECLDDYGREECLGTVEYRFALSGTGRSFPRCDYHWQERLLEQERIDETYGSNSDCPPDWYDYADAGEYWDEDY